MGRFDEVPADASVYEARNAIFWFHDDVLFGHHTPEEPRVTLDDAIVVLQKLRELTGGRRVPLMFDGRGLSWLNVDARGYIRAHAGDVFSQVAIVVRHDLIRLLSHAFLGVAGVDIPIQLFTDEEEAWRYLRRTPAA